MKRSGRETTVATETDEERGEEGEELERRAQEDEREEKDTAGLEENGETRVATVGGPITAEATDLCNKKKGKRG